MSSEERPDRPGHDPSIVDDLVRRTKSYLADAVVDLIKRPARELLRWLGKRAARYAVAAALLATAAVFLMIAGAEGLKSAGLRPWISYLALGLAGLLAAWILLRCPNSDDAE